MRPYVPALLVASGLAAGVVVAEAFQTGQQTPVFRSAIDVVQLDVSVLDKQRRPVSGLTADDFTVTEDGKPQRIVAVSEVTMARGTDRWPVWARSASADVASTDVGDKRILAIVIDGSGGQAAVPILSGVMDRFVPGDVVAVIGGGCEVPFTEDLEKARACLDSMRAAPSRQRSVTPSPTPASRNTVPHSLLHDVVEYLAAVPQRRKAVIYIGNGLLPQVRSTPGSRGGGGGGARGGGMGPTEREIQNADDYRETLWFAHRANVNIYTVAGGAIRGLNGSSYRQFDTSAIKSLAEDTGGLLIGDREPLEVGLDQLFLENGSYYLVGYQASNPSMDGKMRKLSVKVNRADLTVRSRTLLYRPKNVTPTSGATQADVPSKGLSERLRDWMPSIDVAFDADAMPFAQSGDTKAAVAIVTGLTEPVPFGTTRVVQHTDVRCLIYDDRGTLVNDSSKRVNLDVAPSIDNKVRYDVLQQIALAPGQYNFRFVAHNADTDKVGGIEFSVTVPDFAREAISMSGVVISDPSVEPMARIGSFGALIPATPTAVRRFGADDHVNAFLRVHEGGAGPTTAAALDVKILDSTGAVVFSKSESLAAERFEGSGAVDCTLNLPLDRLKPGFYLLTLQASRGSRRTLPRDVRFTVK